MAKTKAKSKRLTCPLCGSRLDIRIEGFTCEGAVSGAYLKGRAALTCSATDKCRYMHTTNFKTASRETIDRLEQVAGELITKLPDFGPWEVFTLRERDRKPRRGKRG